MKFTKRDVAIALDTCHKLLGAADGQSIGVVVERGELTHVCDIIVGLSARRYGAAPASTRQSVRHARPKRIRS